MAPSAWLHGTRLVQEMTENLTEDPLVLGILPLKSFDIRPVEGFLTLTVASYRIAFHISRTEVSTKNSTRKFLIGSTNFNGCRALSIVVDECIHSAIHPIVRPRP